MANKIVHSLLALALGGFSLAGSAAAQSGATAPASNPSAPVSSAAPATGSGPAANPSLDAGPGDHQKDHPWANQINQREQKEQNRVANGIKSGALTPQEAAQAENREGQIINQEKRDEAANGGHLTKAERRQINQEQSKLGSKTYHEEHPKKKK